MNDNEKLLLLELVLVDLRGNWADEPWSRASYARNLAVSLKLDRFVNSIDGYLKCAEECGDWDGRYFRYPQENGGYEGMKELHGLQYTLKDKSEEFQKEAIGILTFPEYRFDDYETD